MSEQNPVLFGKNYFEVKKINKADYRPDQEEIKPVL